MAILPCYHFGPDGLSVAKQTVENFVARAIRLYEQEPGGGCVPPPGLDCTCDVGSGGFRRGCLKVVRQLKNCKLTKLADAVEGTRNILQAKVDPRAALPQSGRRSVYHFELFQAIACILNSPPT